MGCCDLLGPVFVGIMVMPADLGCGFPCGGGLPSSLVGVRMPLFGVVCLVVLGFVGVACLWDCWWRLVLGLWVWGAGVCVLVVFPVAFGSSWVGII